MKLLRPLILLVASWFVAEARGCGICGAMMPGYVISSDKSAWFSCGYRADIFGYLHPHGLQNSLFVQHADFQFKFTWRKRFEWQVSLPYQYARLESANYTLKQYSGLCDMSLICRRVFLRRNDQVVKRLAVGGGVELPVGNYRRSEYEPLMQPGSASVDVILSANAGIRNRKQGINSQVQLNVNGMSYNLEHRANTASLAVEYFREKWLTPHVFIQPKLNIFSQLSGRSSISHVVDRQFSNQYFLGTGAGLNVGMGKWFLGLNLRKTWLANRTKNNLSYNLGCNISLYYIL